MFMSGAPLSGRRCSCVRMPAGRAYDRDVRHGQRRRAVRLRTGLTTSYVAQGDPSGMPVVLLHAWGESLGCFDRLLPLLPVVIYAVAMDQRGHGDAAEPEDGYTLVELADDVDAFMDA